MTALIVYVVGALAFMSLAVLVGPPDAKPAPYLLAALLLSLAWPVSVLVVAVALASAPRA